MKYFGQLQQFLDQAKTGELSYSSYLKYYSDLAVRVRFGQGNPANIPVISFLGGENTTQNGIYPAYLFFKKENLLILAYTISETKTPTHAWPIPNLTTIKEFFKQKGLENPERYGKSCVFKSYDLSKPLREAEMNKDLDELLEIYKEVVREQFGNYNVEKKNFTYKAFHAQTQEAGLIFSEKIVARFVASLCTKPFVICSGLSGSGKTKLAQSFVKWICESPEQYEIVPVGADWTNREPLLGYPNALQKDDYVKPDNGVLDLIIRAAEKPEAPHFLILDEMNLSHVERYFADFLSCMESGDYLHLHSEEKIGNVDGKIKLPKNLFIIGTVNIDETTYMFSPKVLDRANVIEFRIGKEDIRRYLDPANQVSLDMERFADSGGKGLGAQMAADFLRLSTKPVEHKVKVQPILVDFFEALQKAGAEFGYRSASEINRLIGTLSGLTKDDRNWDNSAIQDAHFVDIAIMQKLLPKLHGSRTKLSKVLQVLGTFCLANPKSKVKEDYFEKSESIDFETDKNILYKLSFEKICRMYKNAVENGYASYAEA